MGNEPKEFSIKLNDFLKRARTQNYFDAIKLREMLQVIGFLHRQWITVRNPKEIMIDFREKEQLDFEK